MVLTSGVGVRISGSVEMQQSRARARMMRLREHCAIVQRRTTQCGIVFRVRGPSPRSIGLFSPQSALRKLKARRVSARCSTSLFVFEDIPYYTILYYAILCYAMLCYAMLYYDLLCYTVLCYTTLYYNILYKMLYYTTPTVPMSGRRPRLTGKAARS